MPCTEKTTKDVADDTGRLATISDVPRRHFACDGGWRRWFGGESAVAVAEEDADGVVVLVGDEEVGFSVAVDVGDDGIVRAGASGESELGRESGDGGGEKDAAFELLDDATGCAEG